MAGGGRTYSAGPDSERPDCTESGCGAPGDFFLFDVPEKRWRAVCHRHARDLHPSLEVHAILESGYLRPVELGRPAAAPGDPSGERGTAFRRIVNDALGWTTAEDHDVEE